MADADSIERTVEILTALSPKANPPVIREPLQADECEWFLSAIDKGVVEFQTCGPGCPRLKKWSASGPDEWATPAGALRHLYSAPHADVPDLNREYIPHIAAYARAIIEFGYDASRSSFSRYRQFSRDLITKKVGTTYETDAEFYDANSLIWLQIEAKAEARQVERMAVEIERAGSLDELPPSTVKEIEYALDLAPRYLWLVGPGSVDPASHVHAVVVDGLNATFTPLDGIPDRPR